MDGYCINSIKYIDELIDRWIYVCIDNRIDNKGHIVLYNTILSHI